MYKPLCGGFGFDFQIVLSLLQKLDFPIMEKTCLIELCK